MPNEQIAVSVVIPAYNEEEAAQPVLKDIKSVMDGLGFPYEIIVVDDGSTDSTVAQCQAIEGVQVIRHSRNRGTGAARTTGMQAARGQKVLMTDADGTYPTDVFAQMIEALDSCEMVIGARKREAGTIRWLRSLAKNLIKSLASYMTATKIPDLNSGLRGMKRDAVLRFLSILPNTHSWVSTITMAFLSSNLEVRWIEIDYHKRIGKSTFHPIRDTYNYLTLVVRAIMYFNPLRIFLPLSLGLFTVGFVKAITDIFRYNFHFAPSTVMLVLTAVHLGAIGLLADLIVKRSKL
jgi:glycosyltransferase involved in cell wall biosynthesis